MKFEHRLNLTVNVLHFADTGAGDHVIEMTGAAKCISYYGLADLNEILTAIQLNSACDLAGSRSVKVRHYFQVLCLLITELGVL